MLFFSQQDMWKTSIPMKCDKMPRIIIILFFLHQKIFFLKMVLLCIIEIMNLEDCAVLAGHNDNVVSVGLSDIDQILW